MSTKKKGKKLDPRVERLLLLILEVLQSEDLERAPRIEVATAPPAERAVIR
jgi:hypothetical protein